MQKLLSVSVFLTLVYVLSIMGSGCAQVGMPTGGDRDTLAPVLDRSTPAERALNVNGNRVVLSFDEYVEIQEVQANVLISPVQKNSPDIRSNLRTVTVKLKDTLRPNTTYSINFGNSIKDVNEGNVYKNYTYVFSTGDHIDSLKLSGKAVLAETGLADTTMNVMLYRDPVDSAVIRVRPDYLARVRKDGSYEFNYLPAGSYKLYGLKDGDGGKFYNSKTETFAFRENDESFSIGSDSIPVINLFAYSQEKPRPPVTSTPVRGNGTTSGAAGRRNDKKFKYTSSLTQAPVQDLLSPVELSFSSPFKLLDSQKIYIADTNYRRMGTSRMSLDSTATILTINFIWQPETNYVLMIDKGAISDSANNALAKNDTLRFKTKRTEDYSRVLLRFSNLELSKHPVMQLLQGDDIKFAYVLKSNEWSNNLFTPGEYTIRILFDDNNNGVWDPGNYSKNLQPERTITLPQKIDMRANFDIEKDIRL